MEWLRQLIGLPPGEAERGRLEVKAKAAGQEVVRLTRDGDYAGALRATEGSMPLLRRLWAFDDVARAHNNAGDLSMQLGRPRYALKHYRKALGHWKKCGNERGLAISHSGIGKVLMQVGEHDRARKELQSARDLFLSAGDDRELADVLQILVSACMQLGLHEEHRDAAQQLVAVSERLGDDESLSRALQLLAMAEQDCGDHAASVKTLRRAYPLVNDAESRIGILQGLAEGFAVQGMFADALKAIEDAFALAKNSGSQAAESQLLSHRGSVQRRAGLVEEARRSLDEALRLAPNQRDEAQVLMSLASLHLQENDYESAKQYADRADAIFEALQDYPGSLSALQLHERATQRERGSR